MSWVLVSVICLIQYLSQPLSPAVCTWTTLHGENLEAIAAGLKRELLGLENIPHYDRIVDEVGDEFPSLAMRSVTSKPAPRGYLGPETRSLVLMIGRGEQKRENIYGLGWEGEL